MRAHLWQSLANYTQQGFGLLLGLILARLLQPEDFGAFGFAAASVLLALLPATWSLAPTLIMDAAAAPAFYATAAAFGWCVVFVRLAIPCSIIKPAVFSNSYSPGVALTNMDCPTIFSNSLKFKGRLSIALGSLKPYSTKFIFLLLSPPYIPEICGMVTWLSSTTHKKSLGK